MRLSHQSDIGNPAIALCYRAIEEPEFSPQSLAIALALKNELTNDFLHELSTSYTNRADLTCH
ncbi:hypothetical protein OAP14_02555 [Aliiglaciecola sp.]|nr:hypothetical protein [Aliiglaciecola sp.]